MANGQETKIVRAILKFIHEAGGDGYHVHGSACQRAGEPDIDASYPYDGGWLHLKIEVKTSTGKATNLQIHRLGMYEVRGYVVGIVSSVAELEELLMKHIRGRTYGR